MILIPEIPWTYDYIVDKINELESHYADLSDEQIKAEMADVRREVQEAAPATEPSAA